MYTHTHMPRNRRGRTPLVNFLYLARCVRACPHGMRTLPLLFSRLQDARCLRASSGIEFSSKAHPSVTRKASRFPRLANIVASYNATVHMDLEGP